MSAFITSIFIVFMLFSFGCTGRLKEFRTAAFIETGSRIVSYDVKQCKDAKIYPVSDSAGRDIVAIIADAATVAKRKSLQPSGYSVMPQYILHINMLDETTVSVVFWALDPVKLSVEGTVYEIDNKSDGLMAVKLLENAVK